MPESSDLKISLSQEKEATSPLAQTASAINHASLGANATPPSALSNLFHSNVVASTNLSAQNASSLQNSLAKINLSALQKAIENVQGALAVPTRSLLDVLSNNEVASLLASLKAVQTGQQRSPFFDDPVFRELFAKLKRLVERLKTDATIVEQINSRISGDGTRSNPYRTTGSTPLYVQAPITLGFAVPPSQVTIQQIRDLFGLGG